MIRPARVTRIQVSVPADWSPPVTLDEPGMRRVSKDEALGHHRPHRVVVVGGPHDGYQEWWVSDMPCGCDHSREASS